MHTHPRPHRRPALAAGSGLVAFGAFGGGVSLMVGWIDIGDSLSERLPFSSPVFGGLALMLIVGLPFSMVCRRAWVGDRRAGVTAFVAGVLLVGWIIVQLAFIRSVSFLHPMFLVIGVCFTMIGFRSRQAADHTVDLAAVERFLSHHRIALVGASADRRKFGNTVLRALRDHGHQVLPVNPRTIEIEGIECIASIADADDDIDAAMIMLTGAAAVDAVHACAARGIRHVWLFRGIGSPGAVSPESVAACRDHALDVVVGACPMMFLAPVTSMHRAHLAARRFEGALTASSG